MARLAASVLALLCALCLAPNATAAEAAPTAGTPSAREILDHVDDLFRGTSAHGRATMTIRTEHWERSLTMEVWSEGKERSLIRILAPVKEKGTATLKSGTEIWNYLPKVKRVIKLPSSMMSSSWMSGPDQASYFSPIQASSPAGESSRAAARVSPCRLCALM